MFAIIRTRWQTRPLSRRAKRRSSAAPGSLQKKYAGIVHPPIMVRLPNHSTTSGDHWKAVLEVLWQSFKRIKADEAALRIAGHLRPETDAISLIDAEFEEIDCGPSASAI